MSEERELPVPAMTPAQQTVRSIVLTMAQPDKSGELATRFQALTPAICTADVESEAGLKLFTELDGGPSSLLDECADGAELVIKNFVVTPREFVTDAGEVQSKLAIVIQTDKGNYRTWSDGVRKAIALIYLRSLVTGWKPVKIRLHKIKAKVGHMLSMTYLGGLDAANSRR